MEDAHAARSTASWPVRLVRWPLKLLRTLARVIPQAIDGYFADRCGQHAAGIAYRVLFSLVPLSIVLVAIFGIVLRNDSLRHDVINEIVDALPLSDSGSADVTRAIEKLASPATALGLVSLLVFGWAATGMMASLRAGLEVAMRVAAGSARRPRQARRRDPDRRRRRPRARRRPPQPRDAGADRLDPAPARPARPRRRAARAGYAQRRSPRPHDRRRAPALPVRAGATAEARRRARRRDRHRAPAARDLARLRCDLRPHAQPQR